MKLLMIFISLMGDVWFAAYTWQNHLHECWVGRLVWDFEKISKTFMNIEHAHDLFVHNNNKNCGGVMWLVDL